MSRSFSSKRGFLTFAQNGETNYLRLAYALALSLKVSQSQIGDLSVLVTPGTKIPARYRQVFDHIIDIPWNDEAQNSAWKLQNEWKAYHATPYEETIKLDADMLFPIDIADWWPVLAKQDILACTTALNHRGNMATSDIYRKCFTANDLPNIYTAFMYFKVSDLAHDLFAMAEMIFHNWERFFEEFLEPDTRPKEVSTDVVFALAMRLIDRVEDCTGIAAAPNFVHMKSGLQDWGNAASERWTDHVEMNLNDAMEIRIGRYRQTAPVHYHAKQALTDEIIFAYEKHLGI